MPSRRHRRWPWVVVLGAAAVVCLGVVAVVINRPSAESDLVASVGVPGATRDADRDWTRPSGEPVRAYRLPLASPLEVTVPDGFVRGFENQWDEGSSATYTGFWDGKECRVGVTVLRDNPHGVVTWDPNAEQQVLVEASCPR